MVAIRPASLYAVLVLVPSGTKLEQPVPWQRSTEYCVTPSEPVDAVQLTFTWLVLVAVAARLPGAIGDGDVEVRALDTAE